ncbi:MAG TPA: hypothetical protein PKD24_09310 [Pyrinomonadaceae bacterium]|nr:hypothetical protein [Pyrinomonadaceae bacterium]HMP65734.1 hypothetical protein [Pyrinomonadaceae bacterium]
MADTSLEKRVPSTLKDKTQYVLAFGVIASMLVVANIPVLVVFFFGVFAYLVVKILASGSKSETREIFEFYLAANEMLREDDRKWFGFELNEVISRGEGILQRMSSAPPLVHFAVGALHKKAGDHSSAVKYLSNVIEREGADESAYVYATPELRNYVKILRKIEREPVDAPLTSAAVRSLERARKLRATAMLEECRRNLNVVDIEGTEIKAEESSDATLEKVDNTSVIYAEFVDTDRPENHDQTFEGTSDNSEGHRSRAGRKNSDPFSNRKPISEVLHDIYDNKVS